MSLIHVWLLDVRCRGGRLGGAGTGRRGRNRSPLRTVGSRWAASRPWRSSRLRTAAVCWVVGCFVLLPVQSPLLASQADVWSEEIGVNYEEFAREIQSAYVEARADALEASDLLLTDDGEGYDPKAADAAMALYERAVGRVRETLNTFDHAYDKVPLLFVQLEYLIVKSLSGMAIVFSIRGDAAAARDTRHALIGMAEESRERIAFAVERNVLPQFHDQYRVIDENFRSALSESYVWMGHDNEVIGQYDEARTNYETALGLTTDPDGKAAIRSLLLGVDEAESEAAAVVSASGDPDTEESATVDGRSPNDAAAVPEETTGGQAQPAAASDVVGATESGQADTGKPTGGSPSLQPPREEGVSEP